MENPVIVFTDAITVPMNQEGFDRSKRKKAIHVQNRLEFRQAFGRIRLARRLRQPFQVGAVVRFVTRFSLQVSSYLASSPTIIKISAYILEVSFQEVSVRPLNHHIKTEIPSVERNGGMARARRWNAQRIE